MKLSYSRVELYNTCGMKYKYRYVDKLEADITPAALLFGSAVDKALNYVLLRKKHNHVIHLATAESILLKNMNRWTGQNNLIYFKNEMPDGLSEQNLSEPEIQDAVWEHLCNVGKKMLAIYLLEVLPLFKEIITVQKKRIIENEEGDSFVLITDFSALLQDGRKILVDNKTSSDIKKSYPENSVEKSTQLAIYSEYEDTKLCAYLALQKKLVNGKVIWKFVIGEPSSIVADDSFKKIDNALKAIKREEFTKNTKSCFFYGKSCEYFSYCKYGSTKGLKK